jgi:hypothetical protein
MPNRLLPPPSDDELIAFSRDLKRLIDQAQRIRDRINQRLNELQAGDSPGPGRMSGRRPAGRKMSSS